MPKKVSLDILRKKLQGRELRHIHTFDFQRAAEGEDAGSVPISFLSDQPVEHWFGFLTLDMSPTSVSLDRLRAGGPLLVCHDRNQQAGVIENPRIENGKLVGDCRFSQSQFGKDIYQDVLDRIRRTASSGFMVNELVLEKSTDDADYYRATSWEPFEGSLEPIPADISVGAYRSLGDKVQKLSRDDDECEECEGEGCDECNPDDEETGERAKNTTNEARTKMELTEAEKAKLLTREAENRIMEIGTSVGEVELARDFVLEGKLDESEFKRAALDKRKKAQAKPQNEDPAITAARGGNGEIELAQIVSRHRKSLKCFKGPDGPRRAYRFGQWFLAGPAKNERARQFCRDHGISIVRGQSERINEDGGFTVLPEWSPDIIDLREEFGVFRAHAHVEPMNSDLKDFTRRVSGLQAYPAGNGKAGTYSQKEYDAVELAARLWMVLAKIDNELNEDSFISWADDLASEIAYAFSSAEDDAGFNGDGTSTYNGIQGICTKLKALSATVANIAGLTVSAAGSGADWTLITRQNLVAVTGKLPEYVYKRGRPAWYTSQSFWANVMVNITLAAGGVTAAEMEGSREKQFMGYPVVIAQKLPAVAALSQIPVLFGSLDMAATLGDRKMMEIAIADQNSDDFERNKMSIRGITRFDIVTHDVGNANATSTKQVPGPIVGLITPAS